MLAVRDLEQCSKMYLWVLVGMVVYINTHAARFGPLTWDCLAASGLERSLQRSLTGWTGSVHRHGECGYPVQVIRLLMKGRVGGSFPSPSKDCETTVSSSCQDGCPGKALLLFTCRR